MSSKAIFPYSIDKTRYSCYDSSQEMGFLPYVLLINS